MITPAFALTATERVLPKLALDFTTASLDPRVTFTRTTGASNPATYVNSSGTITAATNNQPRFDYNPTTLACRGLLIEESRANLVFPSDAAPWGFNVIGGDVITNNAGTAPDGTNTAASISPRLGASSRLDKVFTLTSGATYSITFYSKPSVGGSSAPFSLQTLVNATVVSNFVATDAGNGWYRQTASFTTSSTSVTVRLYWIAAFVSGTCLIWGAQLEAGAFATSYIPTTTTALTRNADTATMTGTNFTNWFNPNEGTFAAWGTAEQLSAFISAEDGTINRRIQVRHNGLSSGQLVVSNGPNQANIITTASSFPIRTLGKVVGGYKVDNFGVAANASSVVTDLLGTVPSVPFAIIGAGSAGVGVTGCVCNTIAKIMYWPVKLSSNEIQAFSK